MDTADNSPMFCEDKQVVEMCLVVSRVSVCCLHKMSFHV